MQDYAHYSYWLASCGDDLTPRQALDGSRRADVAILGAGFTGLWTAYYLLQRDPSLQVVMSRQGHCRLWRLGAQWRLVLGRVSGQPGGTAAPLWA